MTPCFLCFHELNVQDIRLHVIFTKAMLWSCNRCHLPDGLLRSDANISASSSGFCRFVFLMRWSTSGEGVGVTTQQAAERAIREKQHVEPTHFHIKPCDLMGCYSQTGNCSNSGKTNGDGFGESKFVSVEFEFTVFEDGLTRSSSST